MLAVSHLSIQFSGNFLFNDISFLINKNDRIGLVGKNGAGKSTLLKIMAGLQEPEEGEIFKPNDMTIGYLPQEMEHQGGKTVFEEGLTAFDKVLKLQDEVNRLTHEVSTSTDVHSPEYLTLITKMNEANEAFSMLGGYTIESETEKVLLGLGFTRKDLQRQTDEFSGGWRMRIELAKILLKRPDLMLLDEPTNHLDIESIQWLENFLKNYSGAIVMVSHDRIFLDTVTNRTIEITLGRINDYKASYSGYVKMRVERKQLEQAAYENQKKQIEETEKFIERFRYKATKSRQVQSRVKQLDKIERIEVEDEDLSAIQFRFPEPPRAGKVVVEAKHLSKSYGEKDILKDISFAIERGERIAFVGKNGEGKSTLSKILAGRESFTGTLNFGHNVHFGYYAQNQAESLSGDKTVFQTIDDVAAGEMRTKVRSLLGAFLFSGEAADKKVKVLSGGEKSRLALAKLLLEPVNFLILDEPTNHLDMRSKDVLKDALMNYSGAMVIVSHDRDFLQGLTEKVYEFRNKGIKEYLGDIYYYLNARKLENLDELDKPGGYLASASSSKKEDKTETQDDFSKSNKERREEKKLLDNKIRKVQRLIEQCEADIEKLEKQMAEIEQKLSQPENAEHVAKLATDYQQLKEQHQQEMEKWEELHLEIEEIKG